MPQVRILLKDGSREDIDVESEESVTASVVGDKVVVIAQPPGEDEDVQVMDFAIEDVDAVVTTPWSESDGEIEMEQTTIWPSVDT